MLETKSLPKSLSQIETGQLIAATLFIVLAIVLIFEAWLHEDAFITLRTVTNFVNNYGLTWNVVERVQVYSHPLWMFLLSFGYFLTREAFFTTLFISITISLLTIILLIAKLAPTSNPSIFLLLVLIFSRPYVDYSTAGLENPLTHLLLALFYIVCFNQPAKTRTLFWLTLIASFAAVNRLDTILFYIPVLIIYFLQIRSLRAVLLGGLPLAFWFAFSLFYYGFALPNTAYTKLYTTIPAIDLMAQGLYYFKDLLWRDPLTFFIIISGIILAIVGRKRKEMLMAAGIILYLLYILRIGGGYMSGRFFTAPLLGATVLWMHSDWLNALVRLKVVAIYGLIVLLSFLGAHPTIWPIESERRLSDERGITDERLFYEKHTGLLNNLTADPPLSQHWLAVPGIQARETKAPMLTKGGVGLAGFFAGPDVYVLDTLSLSDLLSARLPVRNPYFWRVGHFKRLRPIGYDDTLLTDKNQMEDANLAAFYKALMQVARDPLWDSNRLKTIWQLNTGQLDHLLDAEDYSTRIMEKFKLAELENPVMEGTPLADTAVKPISYQGMQIDLGRITNASAFDIGLDGNHVYRVIYLSGREELAHQDIQLARSGENLQVQTIVVPERAAAAGFDMLRIYPKTYGIDKKHPRGIGHLILQN